MNFLSHWQEEKLVDLFAYFELKEVQFICAPPRSRPSLSLSPLFLSSFLS